MKIIDLLNKKANGEEMPKKIKYKNDIYEYEDYDYFSVNRGYFFDKYNVSGMLNEEVEIIEEETKPITKESIEALGYACGEIKKCFTNGWNKSLENKPFKEDKKIEKIKSNGAEFYSEYVGVWISKEETTAYCEYLMNKINELIDKINSMENKQ